MGRRCVVRSGVGRLLLAAAAAAYSQRLYSLVKLHARSLGVLDERTGVAVLSSLEVWNNSSRAGVSRAGRFDSQDKVHVVKKRQRIHVLGAKNKYEFKHFVMDGIARSDFLEITNDPNDDGAYWVVDIFRFDCHEQLMPAIKKRIEATRGENGTDNGSGEIPGWKVFILDFCDYPSPSAMTSCASNVSALLGQHNVHWASRLTMHGRRVRPTYAYTAPNGSEVIAWDPSRDEIWEMFHPKGSHFATIVEDAPFNDLGTPVNFAEEAVSSHVHGVVRCMRYAVREDVVDQIRIVTGGHNADEGAVVDLVDLSRPKDVAHFWRRLPEAFGPGKWRRLTHSILRAIVSNVLYDLGQKDKTVSVHADEVGNRGFEGRDTAQTEYTEALLDHKIVVVAQRDKWEDHYRLFEGLISGAMVLTDPMHPLPLYLEDGESVVFYHSYADLKAKVIHYLHNPEERLAIARKGHQIAMEHHRSWLWMERIIFGDWSSRTGMPVSLPR